MAFTKEDKDKMDVAAGDAEVELNGMIDSMESSDTSATDEPLTATDIITNVATWWKRWYLKAGHKRLARILLQFASKEDS